MMQKKHYFTRLISLILFVFSLKTFAAEPEIFVDRDWLKTSSGEWINGEIISFYDDKVEFDSDEFGLQTIDAEDISEIRSEHAFSVRLNAGRIYTGRLELSDNVLTIHQGLKSERVYFSNVLTMVPFGESRINLWSGSINLGANFRRGNIKQNDTNMRLQLQRRSAINRLKVDYLINKSELQNTSKEAQTTVDNQRLNISLDWFFSNKVFIRPLEYEYFSDPFSNIDERSTYGVGVGYHLVDSKTLDWNLSAGPSYQSTRFTSSNNEERETSGALSLGMVVDWEVSSRVDFKFDYQIQFLKEQLGGKQQTLKTGFDVELTNDFELDLLLYVDRNDKPFTRSQGEAPEKNDFQFIVSVGYEF